MTIVMGGTGHIGSEVALALLAKKQPVTVIARDLKKAEVLRCKGANIVTVDIEDTERLHSVFMSGKKLFALVPPASFKSDTDSVERLYIASIGKALEGTHFENIVVFSTYGAQKGTMIGDLGSLYEFEATVKAHYPHADILRSAFLMSNWEASYTEIVQSGMMTSFYPLDTQMAMVAPSDLGAFIAQKLIFPHHQNSIHYFEGPKRYQIKDVVHAFQQMLKDTFSVHVVLPDDRVMTYRKMGFSAQAAQSYAAMAQMNIDGLIPLPAHPVRGETTLQNSISMICRRLS